jgi:hypothetical protein
MDMAKPGTTVAVVAPPRVKLTPAQRAQLKRVNDRLARADADREQALAQWTRVVGSMPLTAAAKELGLTPQALGNRLRRRGKARRRGSST